MMQLVGWRAVATLLSLGLLGTAGTASASRTQIDGSPDTVTTVCSSTSATACTTPTLLKTSSAPAPLIVDFGFGPFSSVYIYDNGFVSIGAAITPGTNFNSFANFGSGADVFTPGYSPSALLFSSVLIQGPQIPNSEHPNSPNLVVRVTFCHDAADCNDDQTAEQFSIFDLGSGDYRLDFEYGAFNPGGSPSVPSDAYAGYAFNGTVQQVSGADLQARAASPNLFEYAFRAGTMSGVPETSTWAMLVCGFAALGATLRYRRPALAPAG